MLSKSVKIEFLECEPNPSQMLRMGDNNNTQSIADYLAQLLKDKKQLAAFPNVFVHMERLLDDGKLESENYRYMENTSAISELKMGKKLF